MLFSGDIGNAGRPILRDPVVPGDIDVVVMESTYGDRQHKAMQPTLDEFYGAIRDTFRRGGNVIVPTFALERTQELLYFLREGVDHGQLEAATQVFLDSPMAISATRIFTRRPECYDAAAAALFRQSEDLFELPGLHFTRETAESIAVNRLRGGAIIMAGSGMCTGGRIRHHLKHHLWRENCSVIFVGFAAHGTLARHIIDGAKSVRIFNEHISVRARIYTINGFSAHADQHELLEWHRRTGRPERTILVHGDEEVMQRLGPLLGDTRVDMPELGQEIELYIC